MSPASIHKVIKMKNTTEIIIKIVIIMIILLSETSSVSAFNDSFDYNYPDCDADQCKDPRIKPPPEVPPNPRCVHWWCNPEPVILIPVFIPGTTEQTLFIDTPVITSHSPTFVFGTSDIDRYTIFKSQLNESDMNKRAAYFIEIILWDYGLNQTEFENKFGLI